LVYVDVGERPFTNTEPSMRLFGKQECAEKFDAVG
jgi:hypothetical protein